MNYRQYYELNLLTFVIYVNDIKHEVENIFNRTGLEKYFMSFASSFISTTFERIPQVGVTLDL